MKSIFLAMACLLATSYMLFVQYHVVNCESNILRFKLNPVKQQENFPRLPLAFIAHNVTVSYADRNLKFTNATYYYDYYNRAERIDLFNVNTTYLPEKTIINLYGAAVAKDSRVSVSTYVIDYQTHKIGSSIVQSLNCSKTREFWQFGYAMNDMPLWNIKSNVGIGFYGEKYEGKLKYQLWQDRDNGEIYSYDIVTETRDEFARLLYGMDHMVELTVKGDQAPYTVNPQNFNVQLFGCQ